MRKIKELNSVLLDLIILNIIYLLIGEIIILSFFPNKAYYAIGFLVGVILAIAAAVHMSITINESMNLTDRGAVKKSIVAYTIRLLVIALTIAALYFTGIGDMLAALAGMFALKVSAYLQPFTNKLVTKILEKGR